MVVDLIQALWSLVSLCTFVAIVIWAYSPKRKAAFDEAARIPLDDDGPVGGEQDG